MSLELIAGFCLGFVLMFVAMMFVVRQVEKSSSVTAYAGFVGILLGGAVVAFLSNRLGADSEVYSAYAIGLFAGFVVYESFYYLAHRTLTMLIVRDRADASPSPDDDLP